MEYQILDAILEAHEAEEIAQDCGLSSEEEGAALWFNEIYYESTWHMDKMPKYNKFIKEIEGGNLYYDYGANYYFLVQQNNKNESKVMSKKNTIRLTESDLKRVISESVKRVLNEIDMSSEDTFTRRRRIEKEDHQQMWSYLNDAYNMSLNHQEGSDLYIQAFEEIIFPAIERVDRELGWID